MECPYITWQKLRPGGCLRDYKGNMSNPITLYYEKTCTQLLSVIGEHVTQHIQWAFSFPKLPSIFGVGGYTR